MFIKDAACHRPGRQLRHHAESHGRLDLFFPFLVLRISEDLLELFITVCHQACHFSRTCERSPLPLRMSSNILSRSLK